MPRCAARHDTRTARPCLLTQFYDIRGFHPRLHKPNTIV